MLLHLIRSVGRKSIMEISIKIICYIYLVQAMTIVIEILWGNSIVYLLKSKKGKKLTAQIVELNCLFRAQRDIDVSVLEYNNMLYALPYKETDSLKSEINIYVYGKYVTREKNNIGGHDRKILCILSVVLLIAMRYIVMNWNTMTDLPALLLCIGLLIIYVLTYPYIYYFYLYRIRKKLGWKNQP